MNRHANLAAKARSLLARFDANVGCGIALEALREALDAPCPHADVNRHTMGYHGLCRDCGERVTQKWVKASDPMVGVPGPPTATEASCDHEYGFSVQNRGTPCMKCDHVKLSKPWVRCPRDAPFGEGS